MTQNPLPPAPFGPFPYDKNREGQALARQTELTKPPGSLGRLEALAVKLSAFQHLDAPEARPCSAILFAADHPVTRHGITPYPSEVTAAMVANFKAGGAAASVLCAQANLPLHVIDVGVLGPMSDELPAGDILTEDAMSPEVFRECIRLGQEAVKTHAAQDRIVILGEMGIGNTTPAAALAAWIVGAADAAELVGAGTGSSGALLLKKKEVVRGVLGRISGETSALQVLRRAGGRELAALYGAMGQALAQKSVLLIDGFIVTAVAAILLAEEPTAKAGMVFAHRSDEHGHARLLGHLEVEPLLDLGMRLGEASGALCAYPLLERACALHNQMATFTSAAVPGEKA